jgi:hypothetical protein
MQHLTLEELARLVDEPAEPPEAAHLRDCLVCRRELEALRGQTAALATLADPTPSPAAWTALEAALRAEGLVRDIPAAARGGWIGFGRPMVRAAAAVAIFVVGGATGVMLMRGQPSGGGAGGTVATLPAQEARPPLAAVPQAPGVVPASHGGAVAGEPEFVGGAGMATAPRVAIDVPPPSAGAVRQVRAGGDTRRFVPRPAEASPAARSAAELELARAEAAYVAALQRYAELADPSSGAAPSVRMAALERMLEATGAALERAPDDPVINGYHLAALRQRDQLKREQARETVEWF